MDNWILYLIVIGVSAVVVYLLWREREQSPHVRLEQTPAKPVEPVLPLPDAPPPLIEANPETPPVPPVVITPPKVVTVVVRKQKRKPAKPSEEKPAAPADAAAPVTVFSLLKQPQTLVTAWVLQEIFAHPRSRRR